LAVDYSKTTNLYMNNKTASFFIQGENVEISGSLLNDWSAKIQNRIEVFFSVEIKDQSVDFQKLKKSKNTLTLTIGKSVFTDQVIQDFEVLDNGIKLHTIANRDKAPEDFDRW
jgi:hypothetical protein